MKMNHCYLIRRCLACHRLDGNRKVT
jgi:hypothetical protein